MVEHALVLLDFLLRERVLIFLLCVVILRVAVPNTRYLPGGLACFERGFDHFYRAKAAVLLEVCLVIAAFDVGCLDGVAFVLLWIEVDRVVVHHLCLREVSRAGLGVEVHWLVDDLLNDSHVRMVAIVGHWDHRGRWQTPAEAPRAHLGVEFVEELFSDGARLENLWVFGQGFRQLTPLFLQFSLVVVGVED